jgi:hypothetical protein
MNLDSGLMTVIGFGIMLASTMFGVWWRIEGRIDRAKAEAVQKAIEAAQEAAAVRADLAAHRLHAAETFVTKSGMREIRDEILGAVSGIRDDVRHLATRIDNMHELTSVKRPVRRVE